jgi:NDP-sugar pyrophosphorylase family protein
VRPVGVIPAAGHARRLQPLATSKELIAVGGHPVIDYVVERLRAAGCSELRVVTRPDKQDVIEHARTQGLVVVEGTPATFSESIALGVEGLDPSVVVLVGLPDTIWEPVEGFARLVAALGDDVDLVLGLFESDEPERSDVVVAAEDGHIESVHIKEAEPPGSLVWGCFAARARVLADIAEDDEPGRYFGRLAAEGGAIRAVRLPGKLVDVGTPESLERALAGR